MQCIMPVIVWVSNLLHYRAVHVHRTTISAIMPPNTASRSHPNKQTNQVDTTTHIDGMKHATNPFHTHADLDLSVLAANRHHISASQQSCSRGFDGARHIVSYARPVH